MKQITIKQLMKCECGKEITEEEADRNKIIAYQSGTKKLNMCGKCWDDYIEHATTGN